MTLDSTDKLPATKDTLIFLRSLLEANPTLAFAYNGDSKSFLLNELAADSFSLAQGTYCVKETELLVTLTHIDDHCALAPEETPWMKVWQGDILNNIELELHIPNKKLMVVLCSGKLLLDPQSKTPIAAIVTMTDITLQHENQTQLKKNQNHLQMILDSTNAGTWEWNVQTGEMRFSAKWSELLGYSVKELSEMNIDKWKALHHPDDVGLSEESIKAHLCGDEPFYNATGRIKHKDGHWVWLQVRGRIYQWDDDNEPLWVAGIHLDVSSVRAFEDRALASQSYIEAVINSSAEVSIIVTDTEGLITIFNPGAQALLGYSEDEIVGKQTPAILHLESEVIARAKELSAEHGQAISGFEVFAYNARKGIPETLKWTYVCKNGDHKRVSLSTSALIEEGSKSGNKVIGYIGIAIDETAQLAAEEQARMAAQRFAGAFDSTAVGMALVSLKGGWLVVNDALCSMLGYTREELIATDFQTITHPDDLENDLTLLGHLLEGSIPNYSMQKRYYCKSGELIQTLLWVAIVRDGTGKPVHFVSQIQNITEEFKARQQLISSETRLRGLFDLSPIGIILMEYRTGKVLEANHAVIAPTGYNYEEFMKLNDRDITPREHAQTMALAIEQLRTIGRYEPVEKEHIRKDGSRYPVLIQGILMKESDGREVVWSLIEDISDRKRLERIKNEFISTVSHELRTPLTSISGALSLIVGGVLGEVPDEILDMLQIAAKSSERLSQLVNDLLDMDKLLAGKMDLKLELTDLQPLIKDAENTMQAFATANNVHIVSTGDLKMRIRTDRGRLLQVLSNLLSNACKHSNAGGQVELHHEAGPEDSIIISVIDHGKGIPKEFRSRIFQKFAQADSSDTSDTPGTGLGLAICKELIERLGGVIGYESKEGEGSLFWIRLPRAQTEFDFSERTPRVLHVEDDQDFAQLMRLQVSNWIDMDLATSLATAFEKIRRSHYDLILLDLFLPDGHGETLWETIHLSQPDIPIVILSGHEVPRKLADNVAAVLQKDEYTLSKVVSTLHNIFEMGEAPK